MSEMSVTRSRTETSGPPDRAPVRPRGRRTEGIAKALFVVPAALAMIILFGWPVVNNVVMSFQDVTLATFVSGDAPWIGFQNYVAAIADPVFPKAVVNTALFTIGSIAGQFVIGMALAVFFYRKFPLSGVLRALFLLPWLIPAIVGSTAWRAILDQDHGLLNSVLRTVGIPSVPWLDSPDVALISVILVNVWIGIPFNLTLLYSGLQGIPDELYEAGSLDGATGWRAFRHITWPNLRPVVNVVLMLGVIYTLKVIDVILAVTQAGPANATQTLATRSYQQSFVQFQFGVGAALSDILIIASLIFAVIYLRTTRKGVEE